jgi:predicted membrane protein
VTTQTASRWVKAIFLVLLGIVILLYLDKFVNDMKSALADQVTLRWTWDLVTILLWVLVAWLFVYAALTIMLSFTEHRFTLVDVMEKLEAIEKKLGPTKPKEKLQPLGPSSSVPAVTEDGPDEAPPPPAE